MSETPVKPGTISKQADGWQGRLQRHFDHPPAEIWRMLTTPDGIAQWIAPGTIEARPGGRVHIDFGDSGLVIDSTVTAFEEGRLLEYSWSSGDEPARPLRWEVASDGSGTTLALTVRIPADEDIAKTCAGYDAHLEMLAAALEGVPVKFPFELYVAMRQAYQAQLPA